MVLEIIVMIKQVPDAEEIFIDPVKFTLNRSQARGVINPPDENALEAALMIKEQTPANITVITMGPPAAESALLECMGRGADRGILITDRAFAAADTYATSLTLAAAVKKIGKFDLIFAGESTTDSGTGHVGPGVAEFMQVDQITYASSVKLDGDSIIADRELENGIEVVQTPMPAMVTMLINANIPRRSTLRRRIDAMRKGIETMDHESLELKPEWVGIKGSPTIVGSLKIPEERKRLNKAITLEQIPDMVKELIENKAIILGDDEDA